MSAPDAKDRNSSEVSAMFSKIAPNYDMMNRIMCLGLDVLWRKKLVRLAFEKTPQKIFALDMACGSADVSLELLKKSKKLSKEIKIIGADFSKEMLAIAKRKTDALPKDDGAKIDFMFADCQNLPFDADTFDFVTISFGLRNFKNRAKCLKELARVLKKGAPICILEVSRAPSFFRYIEDFIMGFIIPNVAKILGCDKSSYEYLAKTTRDFPTNKSLCSLINSSGFEGANSRALISAGGAVSITKAYKK